jgi:hypothetical protein
LFGGGWIDKSRGPQDAAGNRLEQKLKPSGFDLTPYRDLFIRCQPNWNRPVVQNGW